MGMSMVRIREMCMGMRQWCMLVPMGVHRTWCNEVVVRMIVIAVGAVDVRFLLHGAYSGM